MSIRTDLAREIQESFTGEQRGILAETEDKDGISISRIRVIDKAGEKKLGRPRGNYITLEMGNIQKLLPKQREMLAAALAEELKKLLGIAPKSAIVVGLGNRYVTADALGPKVCEGIFVTRHIKTYLPNAIDERSSSISILSPGVLGITGMESTEILKGVVQQIKPEVILAIDALCSKSVKRIGATIQITDAGICPGSGVNNKRASINEQEMGVKVISIGIPTVVYVRTIAEDVMDAAGATGREKQEEIFHKILEEEELVVTPKEIDSMISASATVLSDALNQSLNPMISKQEIEEYMS